MIIERKSNYVLSLNENQSSLLEQVKDEFLFSKAEFKIEDIDYVNGRIETRTCSVISDFKHVANYENWKNLASIIKLKVFDNLKTKKKLKHQQDFPFPF